MELTVVLFVFVSIATAFPGQATSERQSSSKAPSPLESLNRLNEGLLNHPALSQILPSGNQPLLYGLPAPRYFIMPQAKGEETNQIDQFLDPSLLTQLPPMSFINSRFFPFNLVSNGQSTQEKGQQDSTDTKDGSIAPRQAAVQSKSSSSRPFSPQNLGSNAINQVMSLLG